MIVKSLDWINFFLQKVILTVFYEIHETYIVEMMPLTKLTQATVSPVYTHLEDWHWGTLQNGVLLVYPNVNI